MFDFTLDLRFNCHKMGIVYPFHESSWIVFAPLLRFKL